MNRYVLFPFRGGALVLLLTFTLGQQLALYAGWMGLPLGVALLSWFFKYCFILLDAIVIGAAEPPVLSVEMINPINEQRPLGQALLIAGGVALSMGVGKVLGAVLGWSTAALLLLLLPASIATLGMTGHLLRAAWPPELWSVIRGVGRDYLVLVVAIAGLALLFFALGHYGANSWVLIGGGQLSFLLAFALIGSVLHEHRLALGIEYRTLEEHIAERTEREHASERNRMMDHAYMKFRVGKPLEGWQEIQSWFKSKCVPAGGFPRWPPGRRSERRAAARASRGVGYRCGLGRCPARRPAHQRAHRIIFCAAPDGPRPRGRRGAAGNQPEIYPVEPRARA